MKISEITRHTIVDSLLLRPKSFHGRMDLLDFLKRIWNLGSMPSTDHRFDDAEGDIWQHTVRNDDWELTTLLYDYLALCDCPDELFLKFAETTVHPMVGDADEIADRLQQINGALSQDGFRLVPSSEMSGRPRYAAKRIGGNSPGEVPIFEIVLSFAGEDRAYVEDVAEYLKEHGVEVFYDRYQEATLWGKDLAEHLDAVYRSSARYCVMFISGHYARKLWPNHERRSALARSVEERQEYILPARFDDSELPGIRPTIGYVDLRTRTPEQLGALILEKLGRTRK